MLDRKRLRDFEESDNSRAKERTDVPWSSIEKSKKKGRRSRSIHEMEDNSSEPDQNTSAAHKKRENMAQVSGNKNKRRQGKMRMDD